MLMETRSKVRQIQACEKFIINTCHLDAMGQCMVVVVFCVCACVEKMADMERRMCGVDPPESKLMLVSSIYLSCAHTGCHRCIN